MKLSLIKLVAKLLRKKADDLDAGNSELSESEAMDILGVLCHRAMSKAQACDYLNISPSYFGDLIRAKQMPRGRKVVGYKELRWYKDELDECVKKLKK
jgi:predicted DNA-binding transcriptional regulator AlpA